MDVLSFTPQSPGHGLNIVGYIKGIPPFPACEKMPVGLEFWVHQARGEMWGVFALDKL